MENRSTRELLGPDHEFAETLRRQGTQRLVEDGRKEISDHAQKANGQISRDSKATRYSLLMEENIRDMIISKLFVTSTYFIFVHKIQNCNNIIIRLRHAFA